MVGQSFWTIGNEKTYKTLNEKTFAKFAIVGGSFAGLSTAKYLIDAGYPADSIVVLEAGRIGEAGRRPGGLIVAATEDDFEEYREERGDEEAKKQWGHNVKARELVRTIALGLDCGLNEKGSLYLGTDPAYMRAEATSREKNGFPSEFLANPDIKMAGYDVGVTDPGDLAIDPAKYLTALAKQLTAKGVRIYENSRADKMDGHVVATQFACVKADKIVLAGQNVPAQFGHIKRWLLPMETYCLVTEPLTEEQKAATGVDKYAAGWTDDANYVYFRTAGDRLLFGGEFLFEPLSGAFAGRKLRIAGRKLRRLEKRMRRGFPQLADVKVDYRWGGTSHVMPDELPVIEQKNNTYMIGACEGIPAATMAGEAVAKMIKKNAENPFEARTGREMIGPKLKALGKTAAEAAYLLGA